ncbi:MAG TPA: CDP-diacylglycerol--serine O-phosphatidyltransferase [Salinivirgaceae bacterium]|nr:CDP-diacylglycerol--serine O-phosphatidyltransferase [Salinivirgaceae bacterium]HQA76324.1 CDP-diacylglycerol--serine O-phosphatidyltransferase [Salinivirgaceae bacterium]
MIKYFRFIPNLITSANLFCGCLAVVFAFDGKLDIALYFVLFAAILDFLDGFAARLLKAYSAIGKELDSLADLISFGMAPATMLYVASEDIWNMPLFKYLPFLIVVFSALRLAKFNIDTRQETDFIGLPTPANAIFFISFANLIYYSELIINQVLIGMITLFFSLMLVSEIKVFSLKKLSANKLKLINAILLAIITIVAVFYFKLFAGVVIIPFYLLFSGIATIFVRKNNRN